MLCVKKEAVIYVYALDINPAIQIPTTKYKVYDGYNAQATLRTTIMHRLCIKSHSELSPCTNPELCVYPKKESHGSKSGHKRLNSGTEN